MFKMKKTAGLILLIAVLFSSIILAKEARPLMRFPDIHKNMVVFIGIFFYRLMYSVY